MDRATSFAERKLGIPPGHADDVASEAIAFIWEECSRGRADLPGDREFWAAVSKRMYEKRWSWRSRDVSLDAALSTENGDADGHDAGWLGHAPPDQFHVTYLNQVVDGIMLLPEKHRRVMTLIAQGYSAIDIAEKMSVPVHAVFNILTEGRRFLFAQELVQVASDRNPNRQAPRNA